MSNTQLVVLSVADERSARGLAKQLDSIDKRDSYVTIVDASIAMKDYRGKPKLIHLKQQKETKSGGLGNVLGGITSVFREEGIDVNILRKKAQLMEPGEVVLFILYSGTWERSSAALQYALESHGIRYSQGPADEPETEAPRPKRPEPSTEQQPSQRHSEYELEPNKKSDKRYGLEYDSKHAPVWEPESMEGFTIDEDEPFFEEETLFQPVAGDSSIAAPAEVEPFDPEPEDEAAHASGSLDEPLLNESFHEPLDEPFLADEDGSSVDFTEEQFEEQFEEEPFADEQFEQTPAIEASADEEPGATRAAGFGLDEDLPDQEEWLLEEMTKFDAIAEASRAALIAGAAQSPQPTTEEMESTESDTSDTIGDSVSDSVEENASIEEALPDQAAVNELAVDQEVQDQQAADPAPVGEADVQLDEEQLDPVSDSGTVEDAVSDTLNETLQDTVEERVEELVEDIFEEVAVAQVQLHQYRLQRRTSALEIGRMAGELSQVSQAVRDEELSVLSAVLGARSSRLQEIAAELVASSASAAELAAMLNGEREPDQNDGTNEAEDVDARMAAARKLTDDAAQDAKSALELR